MWECPTPRLRECLNMTTTTVGPWHNVVIPIETESDSIGERNQSRDVVDLK